MNLITDSGGIEACVITPHICPHPGKAGIPLQQQATIRPLADRTRQFAVVAAILSGIALAACTNVTSASPLAHTVPSTVAPTTTAEPHTVYAGDNDNGHTITVATGDRLVIQLTSTYWQLDPPTPTSVLRVEQEPTASAPPPSARQCLPGMGCGTVTATYRALSPGAAVVTASRTTCGEARRCVDAQGSYRLTVLVG